MITTEVIKNYVSVFNYLYEVDIFAK